jgi:hypothetical protein
MGQYFYLTPQNEQKGPVEANQLVALGVNANTLVWTEGMAQWTPAGQVQELASFFAPAAQPAPPPTPSYAAQQVAPQPAQQPAQQAAPQSVVYVQTNPSGTSQPAMPKPGSNMILAVLTTVCCCLPLGIVGIVYASKVDGLYFAGDYAGALAAAKSARTWSVIGIVASLVISIIYLLIYGAAIFAAMKGGFN